MNFFATVVSNKLISFYHNRIIYFFHLLFEKCLSLINELNIYQNAHAYSPNNNFYPLTHNKVKKDIFFALFSYEHRTGKNSIIVKNFGCIYLFDHPFVMSS